MTLLHLVDLLHRHLNLEDVIFHVQRVDAVLEILLDSLFVSGVGVQHIPFAWQAPDPLADGVLRAFFLVVFSRGVLGIRTVSRRVLNRGLLGGRIVGTIDV